jgi:hypothetical protein
MRRLIWILAWTGVALWSLFALGAYGMLDLFWTMTTGGAELAPRPPDSFTTGEPHPLEDLFPFFGALKSVGVSAVLLVWLVGTLMMLGGAWVLARINDALWAGGADMPERPRRSALPRELTRRFSRR